MVIFEFVARAMEIIMFFIVFGLLTIASMVADYIALPIVRALRWIAPASIKFAEAERWLENKDNFSIV